MKMPEDPPTNILHAHGDDYGGAAAHLLELSRMRPALQLAWFARCAYCGACSVNDGACSYDEDEAQILAEERGWWFQDRSAVCPGCMAKRTG